MIQYYYEPAHEGEIIIELPGGSYVPVSAPPNPGLSRWLPNCCRTPSPSPQPAIPIACSTGTSADTRGCWSLWLVLPAASVIGARLRFREYRSIPDHPHRSTDSGLPSRGNNHRNLLSRRARKNIDVGSISSLDTTPTGASQQEPLYFRLHLSGHLALADVITLTRTAAALETRHKAFRVLPASEASFAQLREGPIVLIGGFDNIWTLRVTQKLRFGFESKDGVAIIVDRKSPKQTSWATAWDLPYQKLSRDYAIVARIHDNTTGQPVIVAAGISEEGTEAAGEILYNPIYLDSLLAKLPSNWENLNMEAVIETQVIEGHPGPPSILAVETW